MNAQTALMAQMVDQFASVDSLRFRQACDASPQLVFAALTSRERIEAWCGHVVRGQPLVGGQLEFCHAGPEAGTVFDVTCAAEGVVEWLVTEDRRFGGEWLDTLVRFRIRPCGARGSILDFEHQGLTPALACYEPCLRYWDRLLGSIAVAAEAQQLR